jgi:hypothetical protein
MTAGTVGIFNDSTQPWTFLLQQEGRLNQQISMAPGEIKSISVDQTQPIKFVSSGATFTLAAGSLYRLTPKDSRWVMNAL